MPHLTDFYDRLDLPQNASEEEIRKAYYKAAQSLHPDINVEAGGTELFLDIKEAYETLIDPNKRKVYDGEVSDDHKPPIRLTTHFSRETIPSIEENQLFYALLFIEVITDRLEKERMTELPVNIALVLDCSTSMQGERLNVLKATSIELIRQLRIQDMISVVTFNDRAETILPATTQANSLKNISRVRSLQTRGGTELYQGIRSGFSEVQKNLSPYYVNHVILITDGHTYGDEADCLKLAKDAANQNIGISCFGIGGKWNDSFLENIANITGGSCFYVSDPRDIRTFLQEKFNSLGQVLVEGIQLNLHEGPGVKLTYAFRVHPEANVLPLTPPMRLGNIPRNHDLCIILEFMISPISPSVERLLIMEGNLTFNIPKLGSRHHRMPVNLVRATTPETHFQQPSRIIIEALSRLTLYRMQEEAMKELNSGNYQEASSRLKSMATHLFAQGEPELAKTTLKEAKNIQNNKHYSKEGKKRIKYGTQALFLPVTTNRES